MMYAGPQAGELPIDIPFDTGDHLDVDEIVSEIVRDTRDFYDLPEIIQQTIISAVRKTTVICNTIADDLDTTNESLRARIEELEKPPDNKHESAKQLGIDRPVAIVIPFPLKDEQQGE